MNSPSVARSRSWSLVFSVVTLACSADDLGAPSDASGGGSPAFAASGGTSTGGAPPAPEENPSTPSASGGQLPDAPPHSGGAPQHPLFGAGNGTSVDLSDPCLTATLWKEETAIDLGHGTVVLFEGTLWQLSGESSDTWALPDCAPPGTGWCAEQYAWQAVGTCPDAAE